MGFPLGVVGVGKQKITGRIHIKYVDNMDLKNWNWWDGWKYLEKLGGFKKRALKTDFECESYVLTFTNKLFYEVTHFYKKKQGSLLQWSYFIKESCMQNK
jgi:hypothetical protein